MKVSCVIVDDEPLAVQLLQKHVQEAGSLELCGVCTSATDASILLRTQSVDLVFLDIQMPKLTGLEWVRLLKAPPPVIITTAHREYALEGFALDVVDYLLKPVTFERFMAAVEKYYKRYPRVTATNTPQVAVPVAPSILVKSGSKTYQLMEHTIVYLESQRDFVQFYFDNGKKLLVKYKISQLETELSAVFCRVHKSYIVNRQKITSFTSSMIEMGSHQVPIGNNYRHVLQNAFGDGPP